MSGLAAMLERGPVVLDGGLATELEKLGHDLADSLWSARLLRDRPEDIEAVHRAYFEAGADVAITASYHATYEGFAAAGIGARRDHPPAAAERGARPACARRGAARRPRGGLGRAVRGRVADGAEYTGDYRGASAARIAACTARASPRCSRPGRTARVRDDPVDRRGRGVVELLGEFPASSRGSRSAAATASG